MIVLDTNVVSETMRASPDAGVLAWLEEQTGPVALTAITVGELLIGVGLLPPGKRRDGLAQAVDHVLFRWATILPYNAEAAKAYALIHELSRSRGRGLSVEDGMIAAICIIRGATLATRNMTDFDHLPLTIINPWVL